MWPFRRKPKPPEPPRDDRRMNEDWCAGDVAVCICDDWSMPTSEDPAKGERLRVLRVVEGVTVCDNRLVYGLNFPGRRGTWEVTGFKKLRPDQHPASAEFKAWLGGKLTRKREVA